MKIYIKHSRALLLAATALAAAPVAAHADPSASSIWTLQDENSSMSSTFPHDRFYVNGLHAGWTSAEGQVPDAVAGLGHALFGDGAQRVSLGLTQQLYTPADTDLYNPRQGDEPYAGYLVANLGLIQDAANTRSILQANLGVIGADAGGEIVQNGFHSIIGQGSTHGWAYQLPSEPAVDFLGARIWRFPTGRLFGLETDVLPQVSGQVGLTADYVQPFIGFRLGSGLGADYGPPLLNPSPSGADAYTVVQPLTWYLFLGGGTKFIAHDELLEGANFQSSRSVAMTPVVGTVELGAAVIWHGLRLSYTQVFQTSRYHSQYGGDIHEFGSLNLSGMF